MSEGKNNTVMLTIIGIATLLIAVVGATFAYFSATLSGSDNEKGYTVRSATIGTTYETGNSITATGIYPKEDAWGTKVFTIKSKSTAGVATKYNITIVVESNDASTDATYSDNGTTIRSFQPNALSYTLTAVESNASTAGILATTSEETKIADPTNNIDLGQATIYGNGDTEVTQTYTLSMFFKDTSADQNANQGAQFKGHIEITEITQ